MRFDNAHSAIRVVVDPFVHRETVNDGRTGPRRRRNDSAKKRKSRAACKRAGLRSSKNINSVPELAGSEFFSTASLVSLPRYFSRFPCLPSLPASVLLAS